ncbi:MAG: YlbL family protein [Nocardioidaceae bacterium]
MSRRTLTLVTAGLMLVALVAVAAMRPVPYVAMRPGPVQDTLGKVDGQQIVAISGEKQYPTKGQLDLTTVSVTAPNARLSLAEAVTAWFDPDRAVLPREVVYPEKQTAEQAEEQSSLEMTSSQSAAEVAALTELEYDLTFDVTVAQVFDDAPAKGTLRKDDVIVKVGTEPVDKAAQVGELLQSIDPGEDATLTIRRDGKERRVVTPTGPSPEDADRTVVGIQVGDAPRLPFEISIELGDRIGGPSAGLMFSLAIVDKLTPGPMTGGLHVAGTGEIANTGEVGPIGGIQQKIAGADDAGADVFLVPADNCAEAVHSDRADDLELVRVATLAEARDAVEALAEDRDADVPACRS